jgi:hypothetical protein
MAAYTGWISNQGFRSSIPASPLRLRFSNRLHRRTTSTETRSLMRAERIQQGRNRTNCDAVNVTEVANAIASCPSQSIL